MCKVKKMKYNDILNFIDKIQCYSDEEILDNIDYINHYLYENNKYELRDKFLILAIKTIRDLDKKSELILKYFCHKYDDYIYFEWGEIISILENYNKQDKIYIFNKLFSKAKYKEISKSIDIPKNLKYGIELEYANLNLKYIKKLFQNNMIVDIMKSLSFKEWLINEIVSNSDFEKKNEFHKWIFSKERNNDELPEASSPIMTNTINNLNQINGICTLFKILGARTNGGTALHINIGADYFDGNLETLKFLLIIWSECEELFFKIANEENDVIRVVANHMAIPIKKNIQRTLEENCNIKLDDDEDYNRFMYNIQVRDRLSNLLDYSELQQELFLYAEAEQDKYNIFKKYLEQKSDNDIALKFTSINFNHMTWNKEEKGRIEFRIFNSSLSIDIILQNLLLIGKLCEVSLELANNSKNKLIKFKELLKHNVSEEEKLDSLLNLLFDSDEEKQIFKLRWMSVKDNKEYEKFKTGKRTFAKRKTIKKS